MIIAIHMYPDKPQYYPALWRKYAEKHGASVRWVDLTLPDALEQVRGVDGVMWRYRRESRHSVGDRDIAMGVMVPLEFYLNLPIFPDFATAWHYDRKAYQYNLLKSVGAPIPQTWVFWSQREAQIWARQAQYPVVFKTSAGSASSGVCMVHSVGQALNIIRIAFSRGVVAHDLAPLQRNMNWAARAVLRYRHSAGRAMRGLLDTVDLRLLDGVCVPGIAARHHVCFQEFVPQNAYDTRIEVVGDRAFSCLRYNRDGDFRASGSHREDYDAAKIDPRCLRIAFDLARRLGLQSVAFDFIFKAGAPVITEVSYLFGTGVLHADDDMGYWRGDGTRVSAPMHPAEAQVLDFMALIEQRRLTQTPV